MAQLPQGRNAQRVYRALLGTGLSEDNLTREYSPSARVGDEFVPKIDIWIKNLPDRHPLASWLEKNRDVRTSRGIAVECQFSGSRKHRLGDIITATLHGDIGFVVCGNEDLKRTCCRILNYLVHQHVLPVSGRPIPVIVTETEFVALIESHGRP